MKAATKRALTVSSVQRAELPEAQRQAARAYISRVAHSSEAARAKVRDLEDVVAGLEMLLPIAEHREFAAELEALECERAQRRPRIAELTERSVALNREVAVLPAEPMNTFLGGGLKADEHPKRVEARRVSKMLSELKSADEYAQLRLKDLRHRMSMIEVAHPFVGGAA